MAAAVMLTYPQPPTFSSGFESHTPATNQFPAYFNSAKPSYSSSYLPDDTYQHRSLKNGISQPSNAGSVNARSPVDGQTIGRHSKPFAISDRAGWDYSRSSLNRGSSPPASISSFEVRSVSSRSTTARDRFKSNLKKITQQRDPDASPLIDLSKTAEENELRSGIGIYSQRPGSRSTSDVYSTSVSRRRSHTYAGDADFPAFKPSAPFALPMHNENSRPHSPLTANHSYSNSIISDYGSIRASDPKQRPALRVNTNPELSYRSDRSRNNTNASFTSVVTPTGTISSAKPRKSLDRALNRLGRRDSNATTGSDVVWEEATRLASIQAARQAFDEHQERKDAKYEKRAARDRERELRKQARRRSGSVRTTATETSLGGASSPVTRGARSRRGTFTSVRDGEGSNLKLENTEFSNLPLPGDSDAEENRSRKASLRTLRGSERKEKSSLSRSHNHNDQSGGLINWFRTKVLNVDKQQKPKKSKKTKEDKL